jgi:hypothetical protein
MMNALNDTDDNVLFVNVKVRTIIVMINVAVVVKILEYHMTTKNFILNCHFVENFLNWASDVNVILFP